MQQKDEDPSSTEGHVALVALDGRVITVRDGDVVGRTAVGSEILDIYEEISRRHARFFRREGSWFVTDLGSSNGTFLEGKRLSSREDVRIEDGQHLELTPFFPAVIRIGEAGAPEGPADASSVEGDRRTVTVLFADLKGSVDFFQEKGTVVARQWIVNLYRMLSAVIRDHKGMHVKNIGDAILAVFDDPHEAARAALRMQADLRRHNAGAGSEGRYLLRIGMNMGTVLFEERDVFGNAVNIASRVQAVAPPERIYITRQLYDAISGDRDLQARFLGEQQLKGVRGTTGIYELVCGEEQAAGPEGRQPQPGEEAQ